MRQIYGKSNSGNLSEAIRQISSPDLLIMLSNGDQFRQHVQELAAKFPNVPTIATTGHFYAETIKEGGVAVVAMTGVKASAGVLRDVSTIPVRDIADFEKNLQAVAADAKNTICIDMCTGNDATVLSTMDSVLGKKKISLVGGTAFDGMVAVNGTIYEDAAVYMFIKNLGGKVKAYKENIYVPMEEGYRFVASNTDREKYYVGDFDGKSAKKTYEDIFHINDSQIANQTFRNPLGKVTGKEVCIISLKEASGNGLCCYRQVNNSDVLTILQAYDYEGVVDSTVNAIKSDFGKASAIFSINCVFRYFFFNEEHFMDTYLKKMGSVGAHVGFVGNGEHYNNQFINQSMSCVAFE
ncbi:MAG: hypothetical protein K5656_11690 [Lachnospiraceae bacterium]|nr:hypothetical protein [Lachnospiraceae bacterium]